MPKQNFILHGDCLEQLKTLESKSVNCCVTSPPYWGLRDYGVNGQLGLEKTPEDYTEAMVGVFREVKRVLRDDATLWLNLGDSYASDRKGSGGLTSSIQRRSKGSTYNEKKLNHGLKSKDLVGIPWRVAFALQADGWYLRQDIIWHKPNPMPESVRDRCTKAHEYLFLLTKSPKYYYDHEAIKEKSVTRGVPNGSIKSPYGQGFSRDPGNRKPRPGIDTNGGNQGNGKIPNRDFRNKRSVWTVTTKPFKEAHFATFPTDLIEPCILAGCPKGGIILDPFFGAGTTGLVALKNNRKFIGIELNKEYIKISNKRLENVQMSLT